MHPQDKSWNQSNIGRSPQIWKNQSKRMIHNFFINATLTGEACNIDLYPPIIDGLDQIKN